MRAGSVRIERAPAVRSERFGGGASVPSAKLQARADRKTQPKAERAAGGFLREPLRYGNGAAFCMATAEE